MKTNFNSLLQEFDAPRCKLENHGNQRYQQICLKPECKDHLSWLCPKCIDSHAHHDNIAQIYDFLNKLITYYNSLSTPVNLEQNEDAQNQTQKSKYQQDIIEEIEKKVYDIQLSCNEIIKNLKSMKDKINGNGFSTSTLYQEIEQIFNNQNDITKINQSIKEISQQLVIEYQNENLIQIQQKFAQIFNNQLEVYKQIALDSLNVIHKNIKEIAELQLSNQKTMGLSVSKKDYTNYKFSTKIFEEKHSRNVRSIIQIQAPGQKLHGSIVTFSDSGDIKIFDVNTLKCTSEKKGAHKYDENWEIIQFDQNRLISISQDKSAKVWRLPDLELLKEINFNEGLWSIIKMNDQQFIIGGRSGEISVWSASDYQNIKKFQACNNQSVYSIVKVDNNQILTGSGDKTIKQWAMATNTCVHQYKGNDRCFSITMVNDFQFMAAFSNGEVILWKLGNEAQLYCIKLHSETILELQLVSQGQVASISNDKKLKICKVQNNIIEQIDEFEDDFDIKSICQLNDKRIVIGNAKGQIKILE